MANALCGNGSLVAVPCGDLGAPAALPESVAVGGAYRARTSFAAGRVALTDRPQPRSLQAAAAAAGQAQRFSISSRRLDWDFSCWLENAFRISARRKLNSCWLFVLFMQMNGNLTIGKAMRWWEKGTQPNMREVESAQDLADSLRSAGDRLVVVDFFSPGCGGCRALHPKIAQFAERNPDVLFLQVNYEQHKSMCYSLHVHVLPFFRFYRGAQGRVSSFSCTNATIKKFKDALAKHSPDRCSLGPARGLEESELLALAANRDLQFTYTEKPTLVPIAEAIKMEAAAIGGPWLPLPPSSTQLFTQGSDSSLIPSGR